MRKKCGGAIHVTIVVPIELPVGETFAAACSASLPVLVAFRLVQGISAAPVLPAVMVLVVRAMGTERRGRALGLWAAANGTGQALGPVTGGLLFVIAMVVAVLSTFYMFRLFFVAFLGGAKSQAKVKMRAELASVTVTGKPGALELAEAAADDLRAAGNITGALTFTPGGDEVRVDAEVAPAQP